MLIKAQYFKPCEGSVFVVTDIKSQVAQGVFKTVGPANTLKARIEKDGKALASVRVGHFLPSGDIETI